MKKLLTIAAVMLLTIPSNAQRKGFNLGGNIGVGASTLFGDNIEDYFPSGTTIERKADLFTSISLNIGGMFNNHVGLFSGVGLSEYKWQYQADYRGVTATGSQSQTYVTIPLYFHFITSRPGRVGFFGNIGAELGLLTAAKYKVTSNTGADEGAEDKDDYYGANVTPFVNIGIGIPVGPTGDIYIGPKVQAQAMNNFDDTAGTEGYLLANSLNVSFIIKL